MNTDGVKQLLGESSDSFGGVPVEHMDYGYISSSTDVKELEKILKALRSGKEGIYPDLIKHCEAKLGELHPKSKLLLKDKRPATEYDLGEDEWQRVHSDLKNFVNEAQMADQSMDEETKGSGDEFHPPIRGAGIIDTSGNAENAKPEPDHKPSADRIRSHDYGSWDKYDADKEAVRVDDSAEIKNTRVQAKQLNSSRSSGVQEKLKTEGYSAKELEIMANREKDKGNEAFRAGDYSEAIMYYTRSLSVIASAPAYNNRALARIRLEQFPSAVVDCNKVLELEPDNLKALLRRGTARKSLQQYKEAAADLEYVLSVEPGNKQAKDLLKDVKKKINASISNGHVPLSGGKRMIIQEVEGSVSSGEENDEVDGNILGRRKGPDGSGKNQRKVNGSPDVAANGKAIGDVVENESTDRKNPSDVPSEETTGEVVRTRGEGEQAMSKPLPENALPSKPLPEKVVQLKDEGMQLYKAGQYGHAREKYTTALNMLQEDERFYQSAIASFYSNRSACQLKLGDCQVCISDCDASLKISPHNVKVYLRRGSAYETLERYNYAYLDYQQALTLNHYDTTAQTSATRVVKVLQDQHGPTWRDKLPSRTMISASRSSIPSTPAQSLSNNGTATEGSVITSTGTLTGGDGTSGDGGSADGDMVTGGSGTTGSGVNGNGATTVSGNAAQTNGTDGNTTDNIKAEPPTKKKPVTQEPLSKEEKFKQLKSEGNDFVKKGKYKEAIDCYTACADIEPGQAVSFTNRALCYLKLCQYEKAKDDCTSAISLDPKNVKGFYRRALALKGLGNCFESIKDLSTLLKLEPTNTSAKKELEIVKDSWRKELREKQTKPANIPAESNKAPSKKKKNVLIEEADSDSEEEKDIKRQADQERKPPGKKNLDSRENVKNTRNDGKVTEKHKNHRTKSKKEEKDAKNAKTSQAAQAPKLNKKVTAYEFMQAWMSLKTTKDSLPYARLLQQVPPDQLPTVLSNKLDAPMLTMILKAVGDHLVRSDAEWSYQLLSHLCKAQRFQTVLLFMTNEEKQGIDNCLATLAAHENQFCSSEDIERLRKSFGLMS